MWLITIEHKLSILNGLEGSKRRPFYKDFLTFPIFRATTLSSFHECEVFNFCQSKSATQPWCCIILGRLFLVFLMTIFIYNDVAVNEIVHAYC